MCKKKKKRTEGKQFGPTASNSICLDAGEQVGENTRSSDQTAHSGEDRNVKVLMLHTFNPCSSFTSRDMRERKKNKKTSQLSSRFCCVDKKKKEESQGVTQWVKVIRINEVNLSLVCQRQYFELVEKEKIEESCWVIPGMSALTQ